MGANDLITTKSPPPNIIILGFRFQYIKLGAINTLSTGPLQVSQRSSFTLMASCSCKTLPSAWSKPSLPTLLHGMDHGGLTLPPKLTSHVTFVSLVSFPSKVLSHICPIAYLLSDEIVLFFRVRRGGFNSKVFVLKQTKFLSSGFSL